MSQENAQEIRKRYLTVSRKIRAEKALIFGAGGIGKLFKEELLKRGVEIVGVVRSSGVYDETGETLVAPLSEWKRFADSADFAADAIPTEKDGASAREYIEYFLAHRKGVIAAEKAAIASNPKLIEENNDGLLRYTGAVGGGTEMLKKISAYDGEIREIKAVVNGTLNFIPDRVRGGTSLADAIREAVEEKYVETATDSLTVILEDESRDVIRKAVIIANHSRMFARSITEADVRFVYPEDGDIIGKRCIVRITKDGVEAGFIEEGTAEWLPHGVDNALYINGEKQAEGPGAGDKATVSAMLGDYYDLAA